MGDNSVTLGNASVTDVYMASDSGASIHCDDVVMSGKTYKTSLTVDSRTSAGSALTLASLPSTIVFSGAGVFNVTLSAGTSADDGLTCTFLNTHADTKTLVPTTDTLIGSGAIAQNTSLTLVYDYGTTTWYPIGRA